MENRQEIKNVCERIQKTYDNKHVNNTIHYRQDVNNTIHYRQNVNNTIHYRLFR